jgi:hypothetical protein
MCEKAYRRGAHQAVALKVSESDAAWYRYYGTITKNGCLGFYRWAHALPEKDLKFKNGEACPPKRYARIRKRLATDLLTQEAAHSGVYRALEQLIQFADLDHPQNV